MEIASATPSAATAAKTPDAAGAEKEAAVAPANDFETFLTLLTTQLKNQDPLKPMESTEFVAQLASFSSVEQQVRSNQTLEKIFAALSGGNADGLAQWIGKEVRAPGKAAFEGVPIDVEVTPNAEADRAQLVVRNDFGQEVARSDIDERATNVTWDGLGSMDQALPNGSYAFSVETFKGDAMLGTSDGRVFAEVTEVRMNEGAPILVLADGAQVPMDEITGLR